MTAMSLPIQAAVPTAPLEAPVPVASAAGAMPSQSGATDFLLMLAQLVGACVPQANAGAIQPLPDAAADEALNADEAEPQNLLALASLALPPLPPDVRAASTAAQSAAVTGIVAQALNSRTAGIPLEEALLAGVIQAEQAAGDESAGAFESLHFPTTSTDVQQLHQAPTRTDALSRPVHAPVGSAAWADEIGSRLMMMAEQGKHTASLRLSPEHLGPLEINITVQDDRASVWFGAAHADTRAAIEHALPRLRELFESQGLSLTDAGVFKEPPRERLAHRASGTSAADTATTDQGGAMPATSIRVGLIDAYA